MNISPVSFGSNVAFQEMVSRPQAFVAQNTAVASTSVVDKPKKTGGLKKLLGVVAVAAAAVAGIAYGAKKGVFKVANPEEGNKIINTAKKYLDQFGTAVADFVSKHAPKVQKTVETAAEEASKA